jgi:4-amino-4-deoxy-L-arabinose transferase-like glycosyltransferase
LSFAFFLNEVIRHQRWRGDEVGGVEWARLPEWAWVVIGYTLFIWSSLELITVRYVTPDMCVAAFVYLAAGLIVRIRRGVSGWLTFVILGAVLGFGYLAKAAMFPMAFVFLGVSLFAMGDVKRGIWRVAVAAVVFLLVSSPLLIALSWSKGRVTFGDTGRLNYAWYVTDIAGIYWQGEPEWSGKPRHATRKVLTEPEVYEFGTPVGGTYPLWYDPSYWNEGLTPRFDLRRQIEVLISGFKFHFYFLFPLALRGSIALGLFILLYMTGRGWRILKDVAASWFLLMPAVAAFAMYSLVHVEERFIGSFIVLLFVGLFSGVRLADWQGARRLVACVMIIIVVMFGLTVGLSSARAAYMSMRDVIREESANMNVQVAEGLKEIGAQRGDKVAVLNTSIGLPGYLGNIRSSDNMRWARLARMQIVAEVFSREDKNNFWKVDDAARRRVIGAFAQAGARMIVDDEVPDWAAAQGWQRIGNTRYYAYFLP